MNLHRTFTTLAILVAGMLTARGTALPARTDGPRAAASDNNSDVVFYANLLEEAEEQTLRAQNAWQNAKIEQQRDAFLHDQVVQLENAPTPAVSDEEFRKSQWTLSRSNTNLELAAHAYNAAVINQSLYKLHLAAAQGASDNALLLSQLNEQLWQRRVDIAQSTLQLAQTDRDYYDYHFHMILKLVEEHAESQTTLANETYNYQKALNDEALARDTLRHVEQAHQHAVELRNQIAAGLAAPVKKG